MAEARESTDAANPGSGGLFDREIDPPPGLARARGFGAPRPIQHFQRLLANPFLAAAGMIGWAAVLRKAFDYDRIDLVVLVFLLVFPVFYLFQFHCLDCGATASILWWRSHQCVDVARRRAAGRGRWLRGPSPMVQTVLWVIFFLVAVLLGTFPHRRFEARRRHEAPRVDRPWRTSR